MKIGFYLIFLFCSYGFTSQGDLSLTLHLSLSQAEALSLENNPQVCRVKQLYLKAKEGRLEAFSKWFPQLMAESQMFHTQFKQLFPKNSVNAYMTQIQMTQALFSTDLYYNIKIATLIVEQLRYLLASAENEVLFALRTAYYQVIVDMETLATASERVYLLTRLAERMSDRYAIGTVILYNVNQSKVAIANATAAYYEAVRTLKTDQDTLVKILGFNPGFQEVIMDKVEIPVMEIPELASKLDYVEKIFARFDIEGAIYKAGFPETQQMVMGGLFNSQEMEYWEKIALSQRPPLLNQANQVKIASEVVKSKVGTYLPTVQFTGQYGGFPAFYEIPSTRFGNQMFQWSVGLQANWLIFDGLGRERRIRAARYEKEAKKYEFSASQQETYQEVRKQIFTIEEAIASLVTAIGNVRLAEQTLDLASEQLDVGYISIFDYQISVDNLIQAKNIRNMARFSLIQAYYALRFASGIDAFRD